MDFINRDQVLAILDEENSVMAAKYRISSLFSFPAPNPEEKDGRNVMGQTEEEFWDLVDRVK